MTAASIASPCRKAPNDTTLLAQSDTILSPRFYTTDFAAMDRIDVSGIRPQWDALMEEFRQDANEGYFERPRDLDQDYSTLPPELSRVFHDFLVS